MGTLVNGRYALDDLPLGRGGMGEVWLGRDITLNREVAVKFIRVPDGAADEDYIRRFMREARITARLEHPGVPAVYDVGTHDSRPYLVMQRIRGITVADLVAEQGSLPIGWAAAIAAQVCAVLTVAHQSSLVHRDLKPSNLMLEPDGGVKVLDFGLAVAPSLADFSKITASGLQPGTPAYMAPEQIEDNLTGPAADLYALGCTLHEMLTGERLFTGATSYDVWRKQVNHEPPPVRLLRSDVPAALEGLLLDLLRKQPTDRPEGAHLVYERLLPFATGLGPLPGVLHPVSRLSPTRMYATVLRRVLAPASVQTGPASRVPSTPAPGVGAAIPQGQVRAPLPRVPPSSGPVSAAPVARQAVSDQTRPGPAAESRSELMRARTEAQRLAAQGRHGEAADLLSKVVDLAARILAVRDQDLLGARIEVADHLFGAGNYQRAAPIYQQLVGDLAGAPGPGVDLSLRCRQQEANCYLLSGQKTEGLRRLEALLWDQRRIIGNDDPRTLGLRRQIGLLQLGSGRQDEAEQTLSALAADLIRLHPANPATAEVVNLLADLRISMAEVARRGDAPTGDSDAPQGGPATGHGDDQKSTDG